MILTEDEKLLYDSCGDFVKRFLHENRINCVGDNNVLELCNRCPYYNPLTNYEVDPIAK